MSQRLSEGLGESYGREDDIPALVKVAQKALALHADSVAPTARGAETIKRIFSSLSGVAVGVAELRNEYGPGHGRPRGGYALAPRLAHLAVGSAATYCRMLLETLEARRHAEAEASDASWATPPARLRRRVGAPGRPGRPWRPGSDTRRSAAQAPPPGRLCTQTRSSRSPRVVASTVFWFAPVRSISGDT